MISTQCLSPLTPSVLDWTTDERWVGTNKYGFPKGWDILSLRERKFRVKSCRTLTVMVWELAEWMTSLNEWMTSEGVTDVTVRSTSLSGWHYCASELRHYMSERRHWASECCPWTSELRQCRVNYVIEWKTSLSEWRHSTSESRHWNETTHVTIRVKSFTLSDSCLNEWIILMNEWMTSVYGVTEALFRYTRRERF